VGLLTTAELEEFIRVACKATGYSREQLLKATGLPWEELRRQAPELKAPPAPETMRSRMVRARVPELFIRSVADKDPIACYPLAEVKSFLASKLRVLCLSGGKGTRKSGSAAWGLGQADGGRWIESSHITRVSIEDKDFWKELGRASLLVIDDLGVERRDEKGAFMSGFNELVNGIYTDCRRLIITCNLTPKQFSAEPEAGGYGSRVYDRIREVGRWVTVGGESVRPQMREPGEDG